MADVPETVAVSSDPPKRNAPWIVEFTVEDGDSVFLIFVEQKVLCTTNSFTKSLFIWFSSYYVFNLEYDTNTNDVCLFFSRVCVWSPQ